MAHATGVLRLKPDEFWKLTWAEYEIMCEGHANEAERLLRERWETTRWMTFYLLNIQIGKKKDKLRRLTDLVRFPWDAKRDYEPSTRERFEELCEMWGKTIC